MQPGLRGVWRRSRAGAQVMLVGACLTLATSTVDAAGSFRGTMHEQFALGACPAGTPATFACASVTGTGRLSHLGKVMESVQATINLALMSPATYCAPDQSKATFTTASGDTVFMTTNGLTCQKGAGKGVDSGRYVVTGGTGKYQDATGSGTYETDATYAADMHSGTSVTTYSGTFAKGHKQPGKPDRHGQNNDQQGASHQEGQND